MSLFSKIQEAMEKRDANILESIYHQDYQFVRHQSGSILDKQSMLNMIKTMFSSDAVQQYNHRCVYENDDILVEHSVMDFPDGSREAILAVHTLQDGMILKTETGATPLQK